jgi:hypothetical protein
VQFFGRDATIIDSLDLRNNVSVPIAEFTPGWSRRSWGAKVKFLPLFFKKFCNSEGIRGEPSIELGVRERGPRNFRRVAQESKIGLGSIFSPVSLHTVKEAPGPQSALLTDEFLPVLPCQMIELLGSMFINVFFVDVQ